MASVTIDGIDDNMRGFRTVGNDWAGPEKAQCLGEWGVFMVAANREGVSAGQDVTGRPFVRIKRSTAMGPVGRVQGKKSARIRGSGHPLVAGGGMMKSLLSRVTGDEVSAFFGSAGAAFLAAIHQHGTKPYPIRPKKPGGVLAIPGLGMIKGGKVSGAKGLLKRGKRGGITTKAGQSTVFTKAVKHPGLPARPHLGFRPGDEDALRDIAERRLGASIEKVL